MTRVRLLTLVAVLATLLAGCSSSDPSSSGGPSDSSTPPASSSAPTRTPSTKVEVACGAVAPAGVAVRELKLAGSDGVRLNAVSMGTGPRGVVMLHQTDNGVCGWFEYGAILAQQGFHVLMYDRRCSFDSTCPPGTTKGSRHAADVQTAVATLRKDGATKVAVVGASLGGAVAIGACSVVKVDGCAALSPALFDFPLGDGLTAQKGIGRVGVPLLVADAPDDSSSPLADVKALLKSGKPGVVRFVQLPAAAGHGWSTVNDSIDPTKRSAFSAQLVAFLRQRLG